MTTFCLKIIAIISMLCDHVGELMFINSDFIQAQFSIPLDTLTQIWNILRGIGRFAFPVFAFLLVIGYTHTRDRKKYFFTLMIFGMISQIPYALLNLNLNPIVRGSKNLFLLDPNDFHISTLLRNVLFIAISMLCYYKFVSHKLKDKGMIILICSLLVSSVDRMRLGYVNILGGTNNIYYTLAFGLYVCYCYEKFIPLKKRPISEYLLLAPLTVFWFTFQMDYGAIGIVLIATLFALKSHKLIQAMAIFVWGFLVYNNVRIGYATHINWWYTLGIILAAASILAYNYKKGYNIKWPFYVFYPAHLFVLGTVNIICLFKHNN